MIWRWLILLMMMLVAKCGWTVPSTPVLVSFTASSTIVERGEPLTLHWEVRDAESVELIAQGVEPRASDVLGRGLPARGSLTVTVPTGDYYTEGASISLNSYPSGAFGQLIIIIQCPYTLMATGQKCPLTDEQLSATFQPFEHGNMIIYGNNQRSLFVLHDEGYILHPGNDGPTVQDEPPMELYPPDDPFEMAWSQHGDDPHGPLIRDWMGWATAPAVMYNAHVQTGPYVRDYKDVYLSLPDGRVVHIQYFFNRATSWTEVNPWQ